MTTFHGEDKKTDQTHSSKAMFVMPAFERVQLARHEDRPYTADFIGKLFKDFVEISGDRRFADDPAIIGGFATFDDIPIVVIGHQKGRDMKQRQFRNFGMPKPEGYRKALRIMKLAEKFNRPIISFIDTPGAYPGIDAEERGQAEAIAYNIREMMRLRVPVIVTIIGEGGSGGALAIGIGDQILMLENSIYSVITPEGCAAILWKNASQAPKAAESLRLTAKELLSSGIVDQVVEEPEGGAQTDHEKTANLLKSILKVRLLQMLSTSNRERLTIRFDKFQRMGKWDSLLR